MRAFRAFSAKAGKELVRQKKLVTIAEKSNNNHIKELAILPGRTKASGTREKELLSSALAAYFPITRATAELRQMYDTIATKSKKLAKIAQLKMFVKSL